MAYTTCKITGDVEVTFLVDPNSISHRVSPLVQVASALDGTFYINSLLPAGTIMSTKESLVITGVYLPTAEMEKALEGASVGAIVSLTDFPGVSGRNFAIMNVEQSPLKPNPIFPGDVTRVKGANANPDIPTRHSYSITLQGVD